MSFAATEANAPQAEESFQTFDNFDDIESEANASESEDDWTKGDGPEEEDDGKEEVSEDLKVLDDSQADSEGKVIKDDKKDGKKEKEDKKDKEDEDKKVKKEDEVETIGKEEEKTGDKKEAKKLRMRMGEELFNVDSSATFKVKVDGELQEVPVQELINNWSGKTAWDKKFTELGKERKSLESQVQTITQQKEELKKHINYVLSPLKDETKNSMDAVLNLVELSGENPYNVYRRLMEDNLETLSSLMDMTETERELFFHKKKDEFSTKIAEQRNSRLQAEEASKQVISKVDSLRQAYNVSEEQFVEASEELESLYEEAKLDVNQISNEAVVEYASLKPHLEKVKTLVAPYEENISEEKYGDVVKNFAQYLRDGKIDEKGLKDIIHRNFSADEVVKDLNTKVYSKQEKVTPKVKVAAKDSGDKFESFDDF